MREHSFIHIGLYTLVSFLSWPRPCMCVCVLQCQLTFILFLIHIESFLSASWNFSLQSLWPTPWFQVKLYLSAILSPTQWFPWIPSSSSLLQTRFVCLNKFPAEMWFFQTYF